MTESNRNQNLVTWHNPSGAWYSAALITVGLAGLAYLPLMNAVLSVPSSIASDGSRTATVLVIAAVALVSGIAVAVYPRPKPTRLGYVRATLQRCIRGAICGIGFAWATYSLIDTFVYGIAPFGNAWLTALTQIGGLLIAAALWDPGQKRILRAWWDTVKGYSMSATGAAQ
ncbi:MAG: hypothetical protein ACTHW1_08390 [Ancrocorticia sp.]|uniref:hypothetical protein n=1 Tax=Ancrocorticia sp. TaxID=2593684 RepID=UPI003F9365F8